MSNARFRGIGSSPANPAITTYLDGVPQLNSNSSNIELLDVGQIEFVRGPQSPLFGRNTLGGIVNVTTARPSRSAWTGSVAVPFGNFGMWDARGNVSGPIGEKAAIGVAAGKQMRDGFTENSVTGNDVDSRDGTFAKAHLLFQPNANWETRVIYAHERDRDGDYALGDLSAIRIAPFRVSRNFEGFTNRDINNATVNVRGSGEYFAIESTTGFIKWKTEDETDLDYSPLPLATRSNLEDDTQFTQEVRIASPENAPFALGSTMIKWQAGIEYFNQSYDAGCGQHVQRVRAEPAGRFSGRDAFAGSVDRQQRRRPVRARDRQLQRQGRCDGRPALRSRIERRASQHLLRAGHRAGECRGRRAIVQRRVAAGVRSAIASIRSTRRISRRHAATRRAASIRRRCPAARPTAKNTRGTSRAA